MPTLITNSDRICIPPWVQDHSSFRRWLHSGDFPEKNRICFLQGEVWVDLSMEEFFTHNQVKNEFAFVLTGLIKAGRLGRFVPDGMLLTSIPAGFSVEPDGAFLSQASLESGRARLCQGKAKNDIELEGTPDMVLEVVSASSVKKDTIILRDLYWQADIPEYWLVDVRKGRLQFAILRHTARGYRAVRPHDGWLKSTVFARSFRLDRQDDELGKPEFTLAVQ